MANPVDPTRPRNRLADEPSLYLRQHAHDPVDWRPWGAEAIEEARERDVPVFISIGYSTCYWCHVMARESFSDAGVARELNERFVCIKVDREDRPDLDDLYMTATVIYNRGSGGWPMTVFAEPNGLKPFFAGTYFPAHESMHGRPSLMDLMRGVSDAWANRREAVLEAAESLAGAVEEQMAVTREPVLLGPRDVERAVSSLLTTHDRVHGGFGGAPKFPQAPQLELLLAILPGAGDENTSTLIDTTLRRTLDAMMIGGIHDHLAGGFHRYAVDAAWAVPHFEKMLYDNAQLAGAYTRASTLLDDPGYAAVAARTLDGFLDTEMRLQGGAFAAALDAEVDGREGASYAWTDGQIREALGAASGEVRDALEILGLDRGPGFRDPHHPEDEPQHVLALLDRPDRWAAANGRDPTEYEEQLVAAFAFLADARPSVLPAAARDDKVITAWNALAIEAYAVLPGGLHRARETADFVLEYLRDSGGLLHRSWRDGVLGPIGVLEDYSALACGLLAIVEAGGDPDGKYLNAVHEIMNVAETRFSDPSTGAYFDTAEGDEYLFARSASIRDNATPGGAGMMISALRRLGRVTGESAYTERAARALRAFSADIAASPSSAPTAIINLYQLMREAPELMGHVFAGLRPPLPSEPGALLEVESTTNEIVLREGEPEAVMLRVVIPEGFHVTAPVFNAEGVLEPSETMPVRVTVIEGSGVRAYAEYPAGEAFGDVGERIYRGIIELPVAMEREGEWSGSPALAIAYQACRDDACLSPATLRVGIRLVRG